MKHFWNPEELNNYWSISYDEQELLKIKSDISKIGFIIQLKHYKLYGIFPNGLTVAPIVFEYLSDQLGLDQKVLSSYDWKSRSCRRHKKEILVFLGIKRITDQDKKNFYQWLKTDVFLHGETTKIAYTSSIDWFKSNCIIAPSDKELKREISSVYSRFENELLKKFSGNLHPNTRKAILACLNVSEESNQMSFNKLRSDPGRIGLKTILVEIEKLKYINDCELPYDRLKSFHPKIIQRLYRRVSSEVTWEVKRHPGYIGETLLCVFLYKRREQIIDALVELLIQIIGKLTKRAEKKVVKSFIKDIRKVQGKNILLMRIAKAALENPEEMVKNVVYPIADKQKLSDIINEYKSSGKGYHDEVHKIIRASYSSHYRRMVPRILETMEFRSNNSGHRPILEALDLIKSNGGNAKRKHFDLIGSVPIEDIIKPKWYDIIVEPDNDGTERINKIDYEIAVLEVLRDKLRCKEIWVAGADKYRNPDEDVPPDFHLNREFYYGQLGITENAKAFSEELKLKLHEALDSLNRTIPSNKHVKFRHTSKKNIILSPLERQSEPININKLKGQVQSMWPMTSLLDILKETDLKVNFSSCFKTQRTSERLDKNELRKRLLLTLYGLGTNTGLKRISSGNDRVTYKELLHIRKFYVHKQAMRNAIRETANAIFRVRNTDLWGEGTTACASDSKKFGSWDQNLMTEWHIRYGGRGVMIYWHVDKKSTCILSLIHISEPTRRTPISYA